MKTYFLDTNVLIDFLAYRKDYKDAAIVLRKAKAKEFKVCTSVLSMANAAYILRKDLKGDALYDTLQVLSFIEVVSMTKSDYAQAVALRAKDFEDALQYFAAVSSKCDAIVTRNAKDFPFSKLPVISPADIS